MQSPAGVAAATIQEADILRHIEETQEVNRAKEEVFNQRVIMLGIV